MADKTTTLKTKTNDNVYPKVIGESRKDAFADSSTITHHFYDQTHKVGFQIANETNIKIQNSLQKPAGLTKTKLVGVGTNGQENIEIGDNLTYDEATKTLKAGGSGTTLPAGTSSNPFKVGSINMYSDGDNLNFDNLYKISTNYTSPDSVVSPTIILVQTTNGHTTRIEISGNVNKNATYHIDSTIYNNNANMYIPAVKKTNCGVLCTDNYRFKMIEFPSDKTETYYLNATYDSVSGTSAIKWSALKKTYNHFITLTNNTSTFYFTYQNTSDEKLITLDSLKTALTGKYLLCTGHTDVEKAEYISEERGNIVVGVVDNSDNSTSGITIDSFFTISDDVSPVD